jgi:pyruvate formate lyase activating enzyme
LIRSLTGTSLIEYPGKISSIVFISGCNLYCPFCHNPELVRPDLLDKEFKLTHEEVMKELLEREGFIEAVSITGGEPLIYSGIVELVRNIRSKTDLSVKIDTNGTKPHMLKEVLPYVDYVAMDLKSSPSKYLKATGEKAVFADVLESIKIIMSLPVYEFRTTMVPGIVDRDDVIELLQETGRIKRYVLQAFHSNKTLSAEFTNIPTYPKGYLEDTANTVRDMNLAEEVVIRF